MTRARRALVSGAAGFIGRWSVPPLRTRGYEVHAVLSERARGREVAPQLDGAVVHYCDLLDPRAVAHLLRDVRPTHLLHFAWIAAPGVYWMSGENFSWAAASLGLIQVFQAHGGMRAVVAGSCAEYDWSRAAECHEASSPLANAAPTTAKPYAACKLALQEMLTSYGAHTPLSIGWGRIFSPFGPFEPPQRLVPSVVRHLLRNEEAPCSHGRQVRNFLHVADVGDAFAALLDSALTGAVNIGSTERVSIAALVGGIAAELGRPELLRLGARPSCADEPAVLVPDVTRLYTGTGWRPRFTLKEALADTISWWRTELARGAA